MKPFLRVRLGLSQVEEAATATELIAQVEAGDVDLVLLDEYMPDQPPVDLIENLKKMASPPTVFVLNGRPEIEQIVLDAGADAFFHMGDPPQNLLVALKIRQTENDHEWRPHCEDL